MPSSKVKQVPKTRAGTKELWERYRPKTTFDWTVLIGCVLGALLGAYWFYDHTIAPLAVHDNASRFAVVLRDAQQFARDNTVIVTVEAFPHRPGRPGQFTISTPVQQIKKDSFTGGVSTVGKVIFDSMGVPYAPTRFVLRKAHAHRVVKVDVKGTVSVED
jgi:hypothetical protein